MDFRLPFSAITPNILKQEISTNINDIQNKQSSESITILPSEGYDSVLSLQEFPGWTFTTNLKNSEAIEKRFNFSKKIENLITTKNYDRLIVPETHLLKLKLQNREIFVIAEQQPHVASDPQIQECLYTCSMRKNIRKRYNK